MEAYYFSTDGRKGSLYIERNTRESLTTCVNNSHRSFHPALYVPRRTQTHFPNDGVMVGTVITLVC